mgnify:CR=1 FL=1
MQPLPKEYLSRIIRAVVEFQLIEDNDKILIGLSGGKDSLFMAYALTELKNTLKKNFTLGAITINPMFTKDFSCEAMQKFCDKLNMPYHIHEVNIAETIANQDNKNACYSCAFFRRGAINGYAKEHGYNKIAYAHNHDDAVETFFMNLFYSGQLKTFMPSTYLSRSDVTVIRPLLYFREEEIRNAISLHGQEPCAPPCPFNGNTMRQKAKNLIEELSKENPLLYEHLSAAMRTTAIGDLWPPIKNRKEMKPYYYQFFKNQQNKKSLCLKMENYQPNLSIEIFLSGGTFLFKERL